MEDIKSVDRAYFGGTPEEVPDRYRTSSPLTYVTEVAAPVLVLAGTNDPRCPIRQIDNYLGRLVELGKPHEVYRYDAGHGSLVVDEQIRQMERQLDFLGRYLPGATS
jgi:dipeptidyl aminopeptidase/acylaminoacyl peptidase